MKIFISVGEPSGDLHGANLIRALREQRPDLEFLGFGGPRMAAANCRIVANLTEAAVMWFLQVVRLLPYFWQRLREADRCFARERPDAVVLIDFPGFNWWVARTAKKYGIPVFYYGPPQMWAWAGWRIRKLRRLVDHVLCKLPFEARWYTERGCRATFVGHPYFDELSQRRLDPVFLREYGSLAGPLVTLLPGSRTQEVQNNLPWFLKAVRQVRRQVPSARFAVAAFSPPHAAWAREAARREGLDVDVFVGRTPELIQLSHCCLACSGSVSLELLYHGKPTAVLYWIKKLHYLAARYLFIKVRFITLVNLLAVDDPFDTSAGGYAEAADRDAIPFPEYPTHEDKSQELAAHVVRWLQDPVAYDRVTGQLEDLKRRYAATGASQTAARYMLESLRPASPAPQQTPRAA